MFRLVDFLIYCFITAYTPGANNLLSMGYASSMGFKKSFPFNLGITAGFSIIMAVCTLFTTTMNSYIPTIRIYLEILGAAYMLYLAWKVFTSHHREEGDERGGHASFTSGMLLQFVNVKIYIYAITAMSLYVLPVYQNPLAIAFFTLVLIVIGSSGSFAWALFGNAISSFTQKHERAVNTIMALLLVYCAVSLFL